MKGAGGVLQRRLNRMKPIYIGCLPAGWTGAAPGPLLSRNCLFFPDFPAARALALFHEAAYSPGHRRSQRKSTQCFELD